MRLQIVLLLIGTVLTLVRSEHTRIKRRMYAMCPPNFKRIGSECYYISTSRLNWQEAHFECKDKNSKLAEPEKAGDRKLRRYLLANDQDPGEIWIGGAYDWNANVWHWAYNGREMTYQSFSLIDPGSSQNLQFHCTTLNPAIKYRWSARPCVDTNRFICQHKMSKVSEKNRMKVYNRWNATYPHQLANEVLLEVIDSVQNGTRRTTIKTENATYYVDCQVHVVTHRRVKPVDSSDTFILPRQKQNNPRRRRKRPHFDEKLPKPNVYTTSIAVGNSNEVINLNGHLAAHDIKESVAQFAPENGHNNGNSDYKPVRDNDQVRRGNRGRKRPKQNNSSSIENNETVDTTTGPPKRRQKTQFDREIEIKRRKALNRRRKQELHKKWRQEQKEKEKREREMHEQEILRKQLEFQQRMNQQNAAKHKQVQELEALRKQQFEESEKEKQQAEAANKRRIQIERQRQEAEQRRRDEEFAARENQDRLEIERIAKEERERQQAEETLRMEAKEDRERKYEEENRRLLEAENMRKSQEQYVKEEENRRNLEQRQMEIELERINEENRLREERKKARELEIKKREELLKQQEEDEKKLQEEMKRQEEEDKLALERENRRREEEKQRWLEEDKQKRKALDEQTRQEEKRLQREELKLIKRERMRKRLEKLDEESKKKFFELREKRQREKQKMQESNEANEATIPQ